MDFDALRGHVREMETVLDECTGGHKNDAALTAIKHISLTIRRSCEGNPDIIEKLSGLGVFADVLYGGLKSERFRGPGVVKLIMRNELAGIRNEISRLERIANSQRKIGTE